MTDTTQSTPAQTTFEWPGAPLHRATLRRLEIITGGQITDLGEFCQFDFAAALDVDGLGEWVIAFDDSVGEWVIAHDIGHWMGGGELEDELLRDGYPEDDLEELAAENQPVWMALAADLDADPVKIARRANEVIELHEKFHNRGTVPLVRVAQS